MFSCSVHITHLEPCHRREGGEEEEDTIDV